MGGRGRVRAWLLAVSAAFLFASCHHDDEPVNPAGRRTLMVYMVAENSLASSVNADIAEMLAGMANLPRECAGDRLLVYVDAVSLPVIYEVAPGTNAKTMGDLTPVYTFGEDVNSASADNLAFFLTYAKNRCPAETYGLVLWSHGTGWACTSDQTRVTTRTFAVDNGKNTTSNKGDEMEIRDLVRALERAGGADYILFDACFMQCVEVAYELRHVASHIVASPAEVPSDGANYRMMIPAMMSRGDHVAEAMVEAYQNAYAQITYGATFSAIRTAGLDSLAAATRKVVEKRPEVFSNLELTALNRNPTINYYWFKPSSLTQYPAYIDMNGLMSDLLEEEEYAEWYRAFENTVVASYSDNKIWSWLLHSAQRPRTTCRGVSMFVPLDIYNAQNKPFNQNFKNTSWAQAVWE